MTERRDRLKRAGAQAGVGILAIAAALGLAAALFADRPETASPAAREPRPPIVETVLATRGPSPVAIEAWGVVEPARTVELSSAVAGRVARVAPGLDAGRRVARGELLFEVDAEPYRLDLARARADLVQAESDLAVEMGRRRVAESEAAAVDGELSPQERALVLRTPQLEAARARVAAAEAAVARARLDLEQARTTSPFDAVVLSSDAAPGAELAAGTPVAVLADATAYRMAVELPVDDLRWLRAAGPSAPAEVRLPDARSERVRRARVTRLLPEVGDAGRMARALVEIPDPLAEPRVLIGSHLRVSIDTPGLADGVRIPERALRGGDAVWVVGDDSRLEIRAVRVARVDGDGALVEAGLADGDRVVVGRLSPVVDGMRVRPAGAAGADG